MIRLVTAGVLLWLALWLLTGIDPIYLAGAGLCAVLAFLVVVS